jgi:ABC-type branched-subunit amino acid transport system ATPase component/branched-subunit amino acid ABC-type transport system permease component
VRIFWQFAILGVGVGALYALVAQGLVLIYRSSGVVNFAHGATAGVGGYTYYELQFHFSLAWPLCLAAGVAASTVVGTAMQGLVIRRLRLASPLTRVIATTALLAVIVQAANLIFGSAPDFVQGFLSTSTLQVGGVSIEVDRLILTAIALGLTLALWAFYRFTRFGLATTAVAENETVAGVLGVSSDRVALINWAVGSALAGVAGVLLAPIISLTPSGIGLLVVPALAAAMIGNFSSFPLSFVGGLGVGIVQSELTHYVTAPGWADASPFLVIVVLMVVRGRALPLRGHVLERLPRVGWPQLRLFGAVFGLILGEVVILTTSGSWQEVFATSAIFALICLSVILLTGYAGQLSLAQYALAGMGAFASARIDEAAHLPFVVAALVGIAAGTAVGVVVGLPALRTRGVNLAIVTLGLGLCITDIVFGNAGWTGGAAGTTVRPPSILGLSVNPISHPGRYATMALVVAVAGALAVANVRRSRIGRRLLAVRSNERAAAALGISVAGAKLYAFGLSSLLAATAGVLLAFQDPQVLFTQYNVTNSINVVVQTVVLGVGYVAAAFMAGVAAPGGLIPHALDTVVNVDNYVVLVFGLFLLATLPKLPNGAAAQNERQFRWIARRLPRWLWGGTDGAADASGRFARVRPGHLVAEGVSISFGGVQALEGVSIEVGPGEIVGLIGPNGAGKTSLLDVLSGFSVPDQGQVLLNGQPVESWSIVRRARSGIGRSFQNLELFDDLTVRENLLAACEPRDLASYATAVFRPGRARLSAAAAAAVVEFELADHLEQVPNELSAGRRRLVGLARAVASEPSILLLDEPAAGLDERETRELGELLQRLVRDWGIGIVLVEHDLSLVLDVCDRLIVLSTGRVIASGRTDEVAADPAVIEAFIGSSAEPDQGRLARSPEAAGGSRAVAP